MHFVQTRVRAGACVGKLVPVFACISSLLLMLLLILQNGKKSTLGPRKGSIAIKSKRLFSFDEN